MLQRNIHFVLYSKLYKHGGGVETWASYFFNELARRTVSNIYIYYIFNENIDETIIPKLNKNIKCIPISMKDPSTSNVFLNYFRFSKGIKSLFSENLNKGDLIIYIGSIIGGFTDLYLNFVMTFRNLNVKKFCWVRSKSIGEMASSRNKLFASIGAFLEKKLFKTIDGIITNGSDTQKYYQSSYPEMEGNIHLIHNSVNVDDFINLPLNFEKEKLTIAYAGRLVKAKGFEEFIEIVRKLNKEAGLYKINIYGDDSAINKGGIGAEFKGKYNKEDLVNIFQDNEVFLFLNLSQNAGGLSHSLLEAMAAGRIIIAWNNEIHNQVLNEKNSWLVSECDITEMVKVVRSIVDTKICNPELLKLKCEKAREDSLMYTPESHVDIFLKTVYSY